MKKIFLLAIVLILSSCGDSKKKENATTEGVKDNYSLLMEAVYEKDDTITVYYQKSNYYLYDKPSIQVVKGSKDLQKIDIKFPEGESIENVKITVSSNKVQDFLTIKNISIYNNGKLVVDGNNEKKDEYFMADESFSWDSVNKRSILSHTKKYPPSLVGNDNLLAMLVK